VLKLNQTIAELTRQRDQLDQAILALTRIDHHTAGRTKPRELSAAARRRIATAQKARWKKWRVLNGGKKAA